MPLFRRRDLKRSAKKSATESELQRRELGSFGQNDVCFRRPGEKRKPKELAIPTQGSSYEFGRALEACQSSVQS